MTDYNAMDEGEFRAMVREFIAKNCPPGMINQARRLRWHETKDWCLALAARGWSGPGWPVEYGGMGLEIGKLLAFQDEFDRAGVARHPDIGLTMIGPLLIRYGTDEQKAHYLPRILSFEDQWCQGYSEPGAGSDLAALRTSAVLENDQWVINGQKIWSTLAQDANEMFMLARTDPSVKKQAGISFFLVPMDTPGITVRPIETLAGDEEFCEVFFDNVRIPKGNIVGDINDGWTMAKALLGFERLMHGSPKFAQMALFRLEAIGRGTGLFDDPVFRDNYSRLSLDVADLAETYARFSDAVKSGRPLGSEVSILKIWGAETTQRITEYMLEVAQEFGAALGQSDFGNDAADPLGLYFLTRPGTIYGGSAEIQRNILAKVVLKLP